MINVILKLGEIMKKKTLKCGNCGSSDLRQIGDNLFECAYCLTKLESGDSLKEDFKKDLENSKASSDIKYIPATISEEEFYKKAVTYLAMNKFTPNDILKNAKFKFVKHRYYFFAMVDAEFAAITVDSLNYNESSLAPTRKINLEFGNSFCIELDKETNNAFTNEVHKYHQSETVYTNKAIDGNSKITIPNPASVDKVIGDCVNDFKEKYLAKDKTSNYVGHKISCVEVVALPVYSLDYEYNGKKYSISSSANNLNFIGEIPQVELTIKKECEKKVRLLTIISSLLSVLAIIFACVHFSTRKFSYCKIDIALTVLAIVGFLVELVAFSIEFKRKSRVIFNIKLEELKKYMSENGKTFTESDEHFVRVLRWF